MAGPALLVLGLAVTGSPVTASWLLAGLTVSAAFGGPLLGVLLDRARHPGRLLGRCLIGYAGGLLLILACLGRVPDALLIGAAVLAGLLGPALTGGWTAQLPLIVPPGRLPRANALDAMSYNIAGLAGPALAGLVATASNATWAVATAAALVLAGLPAAWHLPSRPPAVHPDRGSVRVELMAGFAAIAGNAALRRATVTSMVSIAGVAMLIVSAPLLGETLAGEAGYGGLLLAITAATALAANATLARLHPNPDTTAPHQPEAAPTHQPGEDSAHQPEEDSTRPPEADATRQPEANVREQRPRSGGIGVRRWMRRGGADVGRRARPGDVGSEQAELGGTGVELHARSGEVGGEQANTNDTGTTRQATPGAAGATRQARPGGTGTGLRAKLGRTRAVRRARAGGGGRGRWLGSADVVLVGSTLVLAVGLVVAAVAGSPVVAVLAAAIVGVGEGPQLTALFAVRHREAPPRLRSQIFTTGASLKITSFALGSALAGPLAAQSLPAALLTGASLQLLAALAFLTLGRGTPAR